MQWSFHCCGSGCVSLTKTIITKKPNLERWATRRNALTSTASFPDDVMDTWQTKASSVTASPSVILQPIWRNKSQTVVESFTWLLSSLSMAQTLTYYKRHETKQFTFLHHGTVQEQTASKTSNLQEACTTACVFDACRCKAHACMACHDLGTRHLLRSIYVRCAGLRHRYACTINICTSYVVQMAHRVCGCNTGSFFYSK